MQTWRKALCITFVVAELCSATDLNSPSEMSKPMTWRQRQTALHSTLKKYPMSDVAMQTGIVKLFERETDNPNWGEEAEYQDFDDYYEEVSQLCQRVAQSFHRADAWRALVFSTYNATSDFGLWLVSQPESFPLLLEIIHSSNRRFASKGAEMLGEVLQRCLNAKNSGCPAME